MSIHFLYVERQHRIGGQASWAATPVTGRDRQQASAHLANTVADGIPGSEPWKRRAAY